MEWKGKTVAGVSLCQEGGERLEEVVVIVQGFCKE